MIFVVIWGFWPYFASPFGGEVRRPLVIHVHAVVFSGWMALLLTQVILAANRRIDLHRRVGRFGIGYGVVVLFMGLVASFVAPAEHVRAGRWTLDEAASFLILPLGDMLLFAGFFGAAVAYRRTPETHKRLIVLATIAVLFAPAARAGSPSLVAIVGIWLLPLALAAGHDAWTRGRVHVTYVLGTVILLIGLARLSLMDGEPWLRAGRAMMQPFLQG
ncbi:MAG: hypothetical protein WD801_09645 [Gemmatimonadaceae bacterium]